MKTGFRHGLLITIDGLRLDEVGADASAPFAPETIGRLSRDGIFFRGCRSTSSRSLPSTASVLTGAYPFRHGVRNRYCLARARRVTTIHRRLARAGFVTLGGYDSESLLPELFASATSDFDPNGAYLAVMGRFESQARAGQRVFAHLHFSSLSCLSLLSRRKVLGAETNAAYERLVGPVENAAAGEEKESTYARLERLFVDFHSLAARRFDRVRLGRLLKNWGALGLLEETVVSIVSTHAAGLTSVEGRFRLSEGDVVVGDALRVPWLLWSGNEKWSSRRGEIDVACSVVDVVPTLLDFLGVPFSRRELDGISRAPAIRGARSGEANPSLCYSEAWDHHQEARDANLFRLFPPSELHLFLKQPVRRRECCLAQASVREGDYQLVRHPLSRGESGEFALYDSRLDPLGRNDLLRVSSGEGKNPYLGIARRLSGRLRRLVPDP